LTTEPASLDFDTDNLLLADSAATPLAASDAKDSAPAALEFDLGDLNLDLSLPAAPTAAAQADAGAAEPLPDDPLTTKLALAEEFNTIGDSEGARTLVEEVIAESTGELKARAQRLLAELG
jgi:pilus assembly protein FimV